MKTNIQRFTKLLKARNEVQRRLRPILDQYEAACQSLEDEISRIEDRERRRVAATVCVNWMLDGDAKRAR